MKNTLRFLTLFLVIIMTIPAVSAQDNTTVSADAAAQPLPEFYSLGNVRYEAQRWNNCGPATLTNALSYFGYQDNQVRAADWLKPNYEDKNVSPWQMAEFVNTQVPELRVNAMVRYGGDLDLLKTLLVNDFPVIIEKGYDPEPDRLGWMGHYLLMVGYNDATGYFTTHDSYISANATYQYDYIERMWQHFNYVYVVLYETDRRPELNALLGDDADERQNLINAFYKAQDQSIENPDNAYSWFNMGTSLTELELYEDAARAFDRARNIGLPWRMMWYQFGPLEAYYQVGRYDDVLTLATRNMNDGGGHFVEETFYYGGLARQAKGETQRALANYQSALDFNPNFEPARAALNLLQTQSGG